MKSVSRFVRLSTDYLVNLEQISCIEPWHNGGAVHFRHDHIIRVSKDDRELLERHLDVCNADQRLGQRVYEDGAKSTP
jgi:DNA-binding LytR/AlgR family response regulator